MKNLLKWAGILVAVFVGLVLVASIALYFLFPLDKIKTLAAAELSKTLNREVKIEKASLNIFTGLKLEKVSVAKLFSADAIALRYDLWPLLRRQVVISEIGLIKPVIQIEKSAGGTHNFSDLLQPNKAVKPSPERSSRSSFEIFINRFYVKSGRIDYADRGAGTTSAVNNLDLSVSGFELALLKPIEVQVSADVLYQGKDVPLALSGKVAVNLAREEIKVSPLSFSVAGEKADLTLTVSSLRKGPMINFSLASNKLSVDPLLALFSGQEKAAKKPLKPGELTRMVNQLTSAIPRSLSVIGSVNITALTFQDFLIDKIDMALNLANKNASFDLRSIKFSGGDLSGRLKANLNVPGLAYEANNLRLTGFDAQPFSNSVVNTFLTRLENYKELQNKVYGRLDIAASLNGRGVEPQEILKNLAGRAELTLKNGELKRLKTLASIGDYLKSNTLKGDIKFGELAIKAGIGNGVVNVSKLALDQNDFKLGFKGGVDLNRLAWVAGNRLDLKLAPHVTSGLSQEYSLLRDQAGWLELTFELTGTLKRPVPRPILDKPLEKAKKQVEEKLRQAVDQKVSEEAERLKKEATEKLKELIKF